MVENDMKKNVEKVSMMANTELIEAWISSGKASSVSGRANQVTRVPETCSELPKVIRVELRLPNYTLA
jgi:hypothetical protein